MSITIKTNSSLLVGALRHHGVCMVALIVAMFSGVSTANAVDWKADASCWQILTNSQNYAVWSSSANYLRWDKGGVPLDKAIRKFKGLPATGANLYGCAQSVTLSGKVAGTRTPDGQCVALIRSVTKIPATGNWKRGVNVMNPGAGKIVVPGMVIARFQWSPNAGRYVYNGGHTMLFGGYRSQSAGGGIMAYDCNFFGFNTTQQISVHSFLPSGTGVANPYEYFVVVTD